MGVPSEKLSVDVPRAGWLTIIVSELLGPLIQAVILTLGYTFVKSLANPPINALLRLAIIALGPIILNAVVLLAIFLIALFAGPVLSNCCNKFGSIMAAIAHSLSVVMYCAVFEFLWYLERWEISHAVLALLAAIAIQRFFLKFLIALFLSREFKHDESNRAFWTGRWYGVGLGNHAWTQPFREYVVKIVEMSMFATDCITGHVLLFILAVPCLIPYFDVVHSTALFWLRPGRQIRAPIFSARLRKQRRVIIAKYGLVFALDT